MGPTIAWSGQGPAFQLNAMYRGLKMRESRSPKYRIGLHWTRRGRYVYILEATGAAPVRPAVRPLRNLWFVTDVIKIQRR